MERRPVPEATFVRWCRRLDRAEFVRFLADLWAARGYETAVLGDGRISASRDGTTEYLLPVPTRRVRSPTAPDADGPVDVVVTNGRADDAVRRAAATRDARPVDASDLHRMALYAVDRETLESLTREHFDASPYVRDRWAVLENAPVTTVAVALLLLLSTVVAGKSVVSMPGPPESPPERETTTRATGVPMYERGESGPETAAVPAACPAPPPDGVAPERLRPAVRDAATASGLEGWTVERAVTVTTFRGPSAQETQYAPEERHAVLYQSPKGPRYRLQIDRWSAGDVAEYTAGQQAPHYVRYLRWGRYTFAVAAYGLEGDRIDDSWVRAGSKRLLEEVRAPEGGKLGHECVGELLVEPSTTTTENGTVVAENDSAET